jgi:hypothetical protein
MTLLVNLAREMRIIHDYFDKQIWAFIPILICLTNYSKLKTAPINLYNRLNASCQNRSFVIFATLEFAKFAVLILNPFYILVKHEYDIQIQIRWF